MAANRGLSILGLLVSLLILPSPSWGQGEARLVDPRQFGIELPPGALRPVAKGQAVSTMDPEGALVVGRLHVQVGDAAVVLMPDGQLVPRQRDEFSLTDRRFEPIGRDALARRLSGEFKDFKLFHSKHYLYVYKSSDEFLQGTNGILESMLVGVMNHAKACGLTVREPELPLVVVLFPNKADFQKYRSVPEGVTAYFHPITNRVFLHEPRELGELSRELAVSQAISTVAHEGAHQILHNIGVQQRLAVWPMWINEGLAEYFAPTTFGKNLTWKGPTRGNDLRMFELQRYLASEAAARPDGRMIEETVTAPDLSSTGYASAWAITSYLVKNDKLQFNRYLQELSQLGPLEGDRSAKGEPAVLANLARFKKHFGDDTAALESRLIAYLRKVRYKDPFADLPHYLAQVFVKIDQQVRYQGEIFHSSVAADAWAKRVIASLPAEQQPDAFQQIKEFRNRTDAEKFLKTWLNKDARLQPIRN